MKKLIICFLIIHCSAYDVFSQYVLQPTRLPESINKEGLTSSSPMISKDGTTLIFRRVNNQSKNPKLDYFWSKRIGNEWTQPISIDILNNIGLGKRSTFHDLIDFDGKKLFFYVKDRKQKKRKGYSIQFENEQFSTPISEGDSIIIDYLPEIPFPEKFSPGATSLPSLIEPNSLIIEWVNLLFIHNGTSYGPPIKFTISDIEDAMVFSYSEVTKELFMESQKKGLHYAKLSDDLAKQMDEAIANNQTKAPIANKSDKNRASLDPKAKYYALLIGIDDYQYNRPELVDLSNPVSDASKLKDALIENYSFSEESITVLENPNRTDIIDSFETLANQLTEQDNLLIFYAGHGIWDEKLNIGYWLSADAKLESKGNWLSNSVIRDYIAGLPTRHTLLITDACFSGSIFKTREVGEKIDDFAFYRLNKTPSRKAMTSGTLNTVPDESKFMKYLLKALSTNENEYLPSRQLFYQIETAIMNNTNNIPQYGTIQNTGDEGGDFIFVKKKE